MMFKTIDGELKVFNKTILSTQNNLKNLQNAQVQTIRIMGSNGTNVRTEGSGIITSEITASVAQPQTVSNFTKLNNAFNVYNNNLTKSTGLQNAYIKSVGTQNQALGNYLAGLKGAPASFGGYIAALTKAKLATIGLQAASIALNMALTMGVAVAISYLFKGIDYLIHRTERMQEAFQNSVNEFNTVTDELKSLEEELKTTTERLEELQKLADNGTISIAEEAELETLKKTNKELARKIALKQQEQAQEARDVLKDSKKNANSKVDSKYKRNDTREGDYGVDVLADEELQLAIESYEKIDKILSTGYLGDTKLNDAQMDAYRAKQEENASRIEEMYALISPTIEAYEDLIDAGIKLEGEDKTRYEQLKKTQDEYMAYIYTINGTREAFEGLNAEQQRNILINRLIKQGLSEDVAKAIVGSISDEDLSKYWDKNFSFVPPEMKDGETAEEYGKRYAEAWAKGLEEGAKNADKMTVSLSDLEGVSDKIKTVGDAFKEFSDNGYLSVKTLGELKTATGLTDEEFEKYKKTLLNAKTGFAEFNKIMSEMTFKILENEFATIDLTNATDEEITAIENEIAAILRENGVTNANAVAHDLVRKRKLEGIFVSDDYVDASGNVTEALTEELSKLGLTETAVTQLSSAYQLAQQAMTLAASDGVLKRLDLAESELETMQSIADAYALMAGKKTYKASNGKEYSVEVIQDSYQYSNIQDEDFLAVRGQYERDQQQVVNYAQIKQDIQKTIDSIYDTEPVISSGKKSSGSDKPDKEDDTEAKINRINLPQKELEDRGEEIESNLELAESEENYAKAIGLSSDRLENRKQRVEALKQANKELHQWAEELRNSTPQWNEEEWFDSLGNATEAYYELYNSSSKEQQELIKAQFEKISKIKEAWNDNADAIEENTKLIKEEGKAVIDYYESALEKGLDDLDRYTSRLINRYEDEIDILEKRKTGEESILSIKEKQYELTNDMADAQHEADKEIEKSRRALEYLDKDMADGIFNENDYAKITDKIEEINDYIADETKIFENKINSLGIDEMYLAETITAEYERRVEMKKQELEIVKAEIDLQKKKDQLDNVLANRNTRVFRDGQWTWTYDNEKAQDAIDELSEAEYNLDKAKREKTQQADINNKQAVIDNLTNEIGAYEENIEKVNKATEDLEEAIDEIINPVLNIGAISDYFAKYGVGTVVEGFNDLLDSLSKLTGKAYKNISDFDANFDYSAEMAKYPKTSLMWNLLNQKRNAKIDALGLNYSKYASGTSSAKPGLSLVGEKELELLFTKNGLYPITNPILTNLQGGEVVFNQDQLKALGSLWNYSQINFAKPHLPDLAQKTGSTGDTVDNSIKIGNLTIDGNSQEGKEINNILRRIVATH